MAENKKEIEDTEQKLIDSVPFGHLCDDDLRELARKSFNQGSLSKEKDVLEMFNELVSENLYPTDIFSEITKKQFSQINNYLETRQGFPLDRLSAHISRLILKGIREELKKRIEQKWKK